MITASTLLLATADLSLYWHLPILIVLVNLVYSASRYDEPGQILAHALRGMFYIVCFLGGVFLVLVILHTVVARWW